MNTQRQYHLEFYAQDIARLTDIYTAGLSESEKVAREGEITSLFSQEIEVARGRQNKLHGFVAIFVNREVRIELEKRYGKPSVQDTQDVPVTKLDESFRLTRFRSLLQILGK